MNLAAYCTVKEAADISGFSTAYVRMLLASGQLRGEKVGHAWLVLREDVARFVRIGRGPTVKPAAKKAARGRGKQLRSRKK